jgi:uncharacterized protein (TIGR02594 family)
MKLPKEYAWLGKEPGPKMLIEALKLVGTKEIVGKAHNPEILRWADVLGIQKIYTADETAWCALSHAYIAKMAGKQLPFGSWDLLRARSFSKFGESVGKAELGDTLVFQREGGGHVGMYVGEDMTCYHVLGGNQGNAYGFTRIQKRRCIAIRRPAYSLQPANVRAIALKSTGSVSRNEA